MTPALNRTATQSLPADAASARLARRFVREQLEAWGHGEHVEEALLLTSELVTNALLHAGGALEVRIAESGAVVRVEVHDASPVLPSLRGYDAHAVTGRGLGLVTDVSSSSGVVRTENGKAVWFELGGDDDEPFTTAGAGGDECVTVHLVHLPVALYGATQQQSDALLREYALLAWDDPESGLVLRVAEADRVHGAVVTAVCSALEHVGNVPHADVEAGVPADVLDGVATLLDVLEGAEREAAAGRFLLRPSLPEIRLLRDWYLDEVQGQRRRPPIPWAGTHIVRSPDQQLPSAPFSWDDVADVDRTLAVIVADDANRILGATDAACALLGRSCDDLVGARVVEVVPPAMRDAHLAGFTRYLASGETHIIGSDVTVPALRGDGTEVEVTLRLEARPHVAGRTLFVAQLTPTNG